MNVIICNKMRYFQLFSLILVYNQSSASQTVCDEKFGDYWIPSWTNETMTESKIPIRNGMRCKKDCTVTSTVDSYEKCCTCNNCMDSEGSEIDLYIEHVSVSGKSLVLSNQAFRNDEVYKIENRHSKMREFPSNICDWDDDKTHLMSFYKEEFENIKKFYNNIVTINFEDNKIRNVPDMNCLTRLDTLVLKNNEIEMISNNSISHLSNLRVIDFSGNSIQNMESRTLTSPYLSLFYANFSHNEMTNIDVSNAMSLHPFCKIEYESNEITEITNEADFKLNTDQTYGPGFVNMKYNKITIFPDFKEIFSLDNIAQLGTLLSFGFDFRGIPLICDCNLHPFMTLALEVISVVWLDYFEVQCMAPPELAGKYVSDVPLASLTCQLSADSGCKTPECTCVDKPNEDTLVVDCSNSELEEIPDLPNSKYSQFVSLNVSGNHITDLRNNSILSKLSVLDISSNDLGNINNYEATLLENASYVDISDNSRLQDLSQTFQYHNICSRNMDNLQISCNCESLWIEQWLQSRHCTTSFRQQLFQCVLPGDIVKPAKDFTEADLECYDSPYKYVLETIILGVILILLIIVGVVVFIYRYEIFILFLRARQKRRNVIVPSFKYDVFLSYNDSDRDVSRWVENILEQNLKQSGYKVFRPNKDVDLGSERDSHVISAMAQTKNFLVIMTDSYLQEANDMRSWTENEWKYGWKNFKTDKTKNIVLVNFDHVSSFDVSHSQIKAFLRVGCTVDFQNTERNIMEEIHTKLGKPWQQQSECHRAKEIFDKETAEIDNVSRCFPYEQYKPVLNINELFITQTYMGEIAIEMDKSDGVRERQTDLPMRVELREGQTFYNINQRLTNTKPCKFRKCFACQYKEEKLNMTKIDGFDKMFTSRQFSWQSFSSTTSKFSKTT